MMRVRYRFQAEDVCARAAKDKKDCNVAEVFLKQLHRARGDRVAAVRDHMTVIRALDRIDDLRMHTGIVVAGEAALTHTIRSKNPFYLWLRSLLISRAAFAPGRPVNPPPGCVPAPHK